MIINYALPYVAAGAWQPSPELAAEIVWFDALVTNVDRTARNPNLLRWHERLWLIDHGAALYLQHRGLDPARDAVRPFPQIADHVLLPHAGSVVAAADRLAPRVGEALDAAIALVPATWLATADSASVYSDYLAARLRWPGVAEEAERARLARG